MEKSFIPMAYLKSGMDVAFWTAQAGTQRIGPLAGHPCECRLDQPLELSIAINCAITSVS